MHIFALHWTNENHKRQKLYPMKSEKKITKKVTYLNSLKDKQNFQQVCF
jgi:hypothetical protein